jgi:hypothetical protein
MKKPDESDVMTKKSLPHYKNGEATNITIGKGLF